MSIYLCLLYKYYPTVMFRIFGRSPVRFNSSACWKGFRVWGSGPSFRGLQCDAKKPLNKKRPRCLKGEDDSWQFAGK